MESDPGAGWRPDPAGRHQLRYHDGRAFTGYVCDSGIVGVDGDEQLVGTRSPYAGHVWPVTAGSAPGPRRRVGLLIVIGVAVLEGIAIAALSLALVAAKTTTSQPIGSTVSSSG